MLETPVSTAESGHRPRRPRIWLAVLLGLLAAIPLLFLVSVGRFLKTYMHYHQRAELGLAQVTVPVVEQEAIVVLTGDHGRIPHALELLHERGSPLLIISGTAKGISLRDLVNQQEGAIFHIKETWERIVLESESSSTIENAERTAPILAKRGIHRILLVTSDYHMGRSLAIFHQVLPDLEIFDYSVPSSLRRFNLGWKFWVEYWKTFLYSVLTSHEVDVYPSGK